MMTDQEIVSVVSAHANGAEIEQYDCGEWRSCCCPQWDFKHSYYRVKPLPRKPREWWAEVYPDGSGQLFADTRNLTKGRGEIIRVTEQLQPDKVWCS